MAISPRLATRTFPNMRRVGYWRGSPRTLPVGLRVALLWLAVTATADARAPLQALRRVRVPVRAPRVPLDHSGAIRGRSRSGSSGCARGSARRAAPCSCSRAGPASPRPTPSAATRRACCTRPTQPRRDRLRPARHRPVGRAALPLARALRPARRHRGVGRAAPPISAPGGASTGPPTAWRTWSCSGARWAWTGSPSTDLLRHEGRAGLRAPLSGPRGAARARLGGRGRRPRPALPRHVRGHAARPARALPGACGPSPRDPAGDLAARRAPARAGRCAACSWTSTAAPRPGLLTRPDVFGVLLAGDFDPALRAGFPGAVRSALAGDAAPLLRLRRRAFEVEGGPRRRAC